MTTEEQQAYLQNMHLDRGYSLEAHKIMVENDMEWVKAYEPFIKATYVGQRALDRKTKELLQIVVETALRADVEQIRAHIRVALENGATAREILEAMEAVAMPMGMLAFYKGVTAWGAEVDVVPQQDKG